MKLFFSFLCLVFIVSCGSSKSVSKKAAETPETVTSIPEQMPQGGEFTPPKEDDSNIEAPQQDPKVDTSETTTTPITNESSPNMTAKGFDHSMFNNLLQDHVSMEGNVDYKAIKNNAKQLRNYIASLGENMPDNTWSRQEKLAYWINAYNAMTIDLIVRHYPIKSIKDIDKPWEQRYWKLGSKWYNLDDIEHQILRKMDEPRIHFAIVCASFSCPVLQNKAYEASTLETQLTKATRQFLSDTHRNTLSENSLQLSKIFKWFAKDFKQDGSLIDFLNQYTDINISSKAKKSFKAYNWDLNE